MSKRWKVKRDGRVEKLKEMDIAFLFFIKPMSKNLYPSNVTF